MLIKRIILVVICVLCSNVHSAESAEYIPIQDSYQFENQLSIVDLFGCKKNLKIIESISRASNSLNEFWMMELSRIVNVINPNNPIFRCKLPTSMLRVQYDLVDKALLISFVSRIINDIDNAIEAHVSNEEIIETLKSETNGFNRNTLTDANFDTYYKQLCDGKTQLTPKRTKERITMLPFFSQLSLTPFIFLPNNLKKIYDYFFQPNENQYINNVLASISKINLPGCNDLYLSFSKKTYLVIITTMLDVINQYKEEYDNNTLTFGVSQETHQDQI